VEKSEFSVVLLGEMLLLFKCLDPLFVVKSGQERERVVPSGLKIFFLILN